MVDLAPEIQAFAARLRSELEAIDGVEETMVEGVLQSAVLLKVLRADPRAHQPFNNDEWDKAHRRASYDFFSSYDRLNRRQSGNGPGPRRRPLPPRTAALNAVEATRSTETPPPAPVRAEAPACQSEPSPRPISGQAALAIPPIHLERPLPLPTPPPRQAARPRKRLDPKKHQQHQRARGASNRTSPPRIPSIQSVWITPAPTTTRASPA